MYLKLLLFCSVILACKSQNTSTMASENQPGYEILIQDSHSNIEQAVLKEIQNREELAQLMNQINSTRKPGFPMPEVDFTQQRIGFANLGQKNTGGYSVTIDRVEEKPTQTHVFLRTTKPGMMATSVITTPFVLFRIDNNKALLLEYVED